ncbi:hypothetical protein CDAR_443461 [Caerostris darwini]|uniref:Uncharacterized protein n=1 Tax=Caerostris darwini TaxID=1538125 RepID=A0AAV4R8K5_9ARAC|nr:hypothetical protein CDAR_443461 [Caerostris darwini]
MEEELAAMKERVEKKSWDYESVVSRSLLVTCCTRCQNGFFPRKQCSHTDHQLIILHKWYISITKPPFQSTFQKKKKETAFVPKEDSDSLCNCLLGCFPLCESFWVRHLLKRRRAPSSLMRKDSTKKIQDGIKEKNGLSDEILVSQEECQGGVCALCVCFVEDGVCFFFLYVCVQSMLLTSNSRDIQNSPVNHMRNKDEEH